MMIAYSKNTPREIMIDGFGIFNLREFESAYIACMLESTQVEACKLLRTVEKVRVPDAVVLIKAARACHREGVVL